MKVIVCSIAVLILVALPASATFQCGYVLVDSHDEIWAGSTVNVSTYDYMCWESIDVSATPDPVPYWPPDDGGITPEPCCTDPGGGGPPIDPDYWMRVSVSDESPYAPRVRVEVSEGITRIWLLKDGQQIGYITPPSTDFELPSLDNMVAGGSFEVQATDDRATQVLVENFHLNRSHSVARNSGELLLQYMYKPPIAGADPDYRIAHYWHVAGLSVTYADWDCATFGARNGRVFHEHMQQSLFWDNSSVGDGQTPAVYPTAFNGSYTMTPYVGFNQFLLEPCGTTGLTVYGWSWIPYNQRVSNCTWPAMYSAADSPSGTSSIDELNASNMWPAPPGVIIGDQTLTVNP